MLAYRAGDADAFATLYRRYPSARPAAPAVATSRGDVERSPTAWLEEIRALRREGKSEEAERQLRAFRRANPDYALPEEFRR